MYRLNYSFNNSDIKAITAALSVLTAYDFVTDGEIDMLSSLSASVGSKLFFKQFEQISNRELYVIALAIDSAYKALRNEISIDEESNAELRDYILLTTNWSHFFLLYWKMNRLLQNLVFCHVKAVVYIQRLFYHFLFFFPFRSWASPF